MKNLSGKNFSPQKFFMSLPTGLVLVAHASRLAGRTSGGWNYIEHEAYLNESTEESLTTDKRKWLYSEVFGITVRTPRSCAKNESFYDVTPVLEQAASGDPGYIPAELLQKMYCDFSHCPYFQKRRSGHAAGVPVNIAKPFLCPLKDKVGK